MRKRRSKIGLGIVVLTAVLLLGTSHVSFAKGEVKEFQIGSNMPLSGPGASWGIPLREAMDVYVELVNEDGGLPVGAHNYKIKLIFIDDKYTSEGARKAAETLIYQHKVPFMAGMWGSAIIPAIAPLANKEKVIIVHGNAGGAEVVKPAWPYTFQYTSRLVTALSSQLKVLKKEKPEVKRIGALFRDDALGAVFTRTLDNQRAAIEQDLGVKIAWAPTLYPPGTNDFYPYLGKLKQADVDAVWGVPAPAELALWCKQSRELGYNFWFVGFGPLDLESFLPVAGEEAAQYVYAQYCPVWEIPTTPPKYKKMAERIRERYFKKYGKPLIYDGSFAYGNSQLALLFEGLMKAGTLNPDVVRQVLQTETFSTFLGTCKADGEKTYGIKNTFPVPSHVGKIKGDKLVYIGKAVDTLP